MKGFLLGLLVAALAFGGYLFWKQRRPARRRADSECAPTPGAPKQKKRAPAAGAQRVARATRPERSGPGGRAERPAEPELEPEPEPEPIKLSAADLRSVSQGDDLGRPDVVRWTWATTASCPSWPRRTSTPASGRRRRPSSSCISRARPDAEAYVPGLVNIKFRIQRQGTVRGVRVEAPVILQKGGLYSCVKGVVGGMRFPASGSSQIVTYPFRLS